MKHYLNLIIEFTRDQSLIESGCFSSKFDRIGGRGLKRQIWMTDCNSPRQLGNIQYQNVIFPAKQGNCKIKQLIYYKYLVWLWVKNLIKKKQWKKEQSRKEKKECFGFLYSHNLERYWVSGLRMEKLLKHTILGKHNHYWQYFSWCEKVETETTPI